MTAFIIAEIGSVHDGSLGNALKLIDAARECGADAVKFQTHVAEAETTATAPSPSYFTAEPRFAYFKRTAFTLDQWKALQARCSEIGITFLSSPFSETAVDLLEQIGMPIYKIPSGEVSNTPLLEKIARLHKPILLSSGMSSWAELDRAVALIRKHHDQITLMQCTSQYPCDYARVGLNVMQEMRTRYGFPVGLSDHTVTIYAPIAAVTLGAVVIEKHFTFSRRMYGSDAANSLEPSQFRDMVDGIRAVEAMLTVAVDKNDLTPFTAMKSIFEKSVVVLKDVAAGTRLTREMLALKKPGSGIPAARLDQVIGRTTARSIAADTVLQESDVIWSDQ